MNLELIYDGDCPNVPAARTLLQDACKQLKIKPEWKEWDRSAADCPAYASAYGSPTILINGKDAAGEAPTEASCCRIYTDTGGMKGVPSLATLLSVMKSALGNSGSGIKGNWKNALASIPALGAFLLPVLTCPGCWPAYAGLMSSLGVGFFNYQPYLLPFTIVALGFALFALGFRAETRRGYAPLMIGTLASAAMLAGKFVFKYEPLSYLGIALLIGASLWNAWPREVQKKGACAVSPAV